MTKTSREGLSIIEIIIVLAILSILFAIVITVFANLRNDRAFLGDVEQVTTVLALARNQTLSSKNALQYGVHFSPHEVVLFSGASYDQNDSSNQVFSFSSDDTTINTNLTLGGSDVVFIKLTGETTNSGTVTITSTKLSRVRTLTIHKTGLMDLQ